MSSNVWRQYMPPLTVGPDKRFRVEEQLDAEGDSIFVLSGEGPAVYSYSIWEIEEEIVRRGGDVARVMRRAFGLFA